MPAESGPAPTPGSILVEGATKSYATGNPGLLAAATRTRRRRGDGAGTFDALRSIDLRVEPGESVGIVGPNGAGKTTLLRLIAGVTAPTSGRVRIGGRTTSMIDLGLGFHPEMNGWDNLECSAILLGLRRSEIRALTPAIVEFSGIADALDRPLRTFSTGMRARLGFAIATHVPSDVLVIDEVLAVGDREFQIACIGRVAELVAAGTTLLFVSHEMPLVTQVCQRAVHLRQGVIVEDGPARDVVERYLHPSASRMRPMDDPALRFVSCELVRPEIRPWEPVEIAMTVEVTDAEAQPQIGIDLSLPTFEPDNVFMSTTDDLPGIDGPGTYTFLGTSEPYPGDSGLVRITLSLVDGNAFRTCDTRVLEFELPAAATTRPRLALQPTWHAAPTSTAGALTSLPDPRRPDTADTPAARVTDVVKRYRRPAALTGHTDRGWAGAFTRAEPTTALGPCSIDLHGGEVTGVIGPNGAGKSTLLRLLAGVTAPEDGTVACRGRVVPVLELGLGFHPDLTGHHNLGIAARLLGLDRRTIEAVRHDIVDFAGLREVMDEPVRTYSSGMLARLGLALAVHSEPDVLLLDEILAVGDEDFRRRAFQRIRAIAEAGAAVVFVSHDLRLIEEVSDRVIRLDAGRVTDDGRPDEVIERFGGRGWAGGTYAATAGIRVRDFRLRSRQLRANESIAFDGLIEVAQPSDHTRIELSLRVPLDDRTRVLDRSEFESRCFFVATVEPAGGVLSRAGWVEFRGELERIPFTGVEMDVVVSVVDRRDGTVVSENWQEASVGSIRPGELPRPLFRFSWAGTVKQ